MDDMDELFTTAWEAPTSAFGAPVTNICPFTFFPFPWLFVVRAPILTLADRLWVAFRRHWYNRI